MFFWYREQIYDIKTKSKALYARMNRKTAHHLSSRNTCHSEVNARNPYCYRLVGDSSLHAVLFRMTVLSFRARAQARRGISFSVIPNEHEESPAMHILHCVPFRMTIVSFRANARNLQLYSPIGKGFFLPSVVRMTVRVTISLQ